MHIQWGTNCLELQFLMICHFVSSFGRGLCSASSYWCSKFFLCVFLLFIFLFPFSQCLHVFCGEWVAPVHGPSRSLQEAFLRPMPTCLLCRLKCGAGDVARKGNLDMETSFPGQNPPINRTAQSWLSSLTAHELHKIPGLSIIMCSARMRTDSLDALQRNIMCWFLSRSFQTAACLCKESEW